MTFSSNDAACISAVNRRQVLRTGWLAGVGVATMGAGLLSVGSAASADVGTQAFAIQEGWRWCRKCQSFFYGTPGSRCAVGGAHDSTGSSRYYLWYSDDPPIANMQSGWRWCRKCQSLAYAGGGAGWCPGSGRHDHSGSFNYHLWHEVGPVFDGEQDQWRWCRKCQGLFYGPNQGSSWCPESRRHDSAGSGNYMIQFVSTSLPSTAAARRPVRSAK